MNLPFLPFALPDIGEEEIAEVVACLRSGWVTTGPKTRQFESDFAAYLGEGIETISLNSATAGLHLALEALGIGPGDEVIVPTMTFTATAEVVRYFGAIPVLADVDPDTLNLTAEGIEKALTPQTKAVIPVHYAGLPCDMDAILAVARAHDLRVIEDAAHAFPTLYKSKLVGTLGSDATVFSFYANKTMTTGEGGMVATRDKAVAARIRLMRIHGIRQDAFARYTATTPSWFYEVVAAGFKYNLTDIASAIGVQQLRKIDAFLERRQVMAARYREALSALPLRLPCDVPPGSGSRHAWHLYVVRIDDNSGLDRDGLIGRLCELGIGTSVHFIPLHRHPIWRSTCGRNDADFPAAEASFASMLSLPLYTKMSDDDQERVIDAVRMVFAEIGR